MTEKTKLRYPPPPWKRPKKDRMFASISEMCREMGVKEVTARGWFRAGDLKRRKDGKIDSKAVCRYLEARQAEWDLHMEARKAKRGGASDPGDLNALQRARLRMLNIETRERARELVEVSSVRESYLKLCEGVKSEFMALGLKYSGQLEMVTSAQAQEILNEAAAKSLRSMEELAETLMLRHPDPERIPDDYSLLGGEDGGDWGGPDEGDSGGDGESAGEGE